MLYHELEEMKKDYIVIEKNRLTMRSIFYMEKNNIDLSHVEYRDKKMNLKNKEKRFINYIGNYTKPLHFDTIEQFEQFSFAKKTKVDISILREGVKNDSNRTSGS